MSKISWEANGRITVPNGRAKDFIVGLLAEEGYDYDGHEIVYDGVDDSLGRDGFIISFTLKTEYMIHKCKRSTNRLKGE